jgi:hypothetical protein
MNICKKQIEQMKKILVPNDFSVNPLLVLKKVMEEQQTESFKIVLLHGIFTPDSITELLFYNKKVNLYEKENKDFLKACDLFKNKYDSRIVSFHSDIIISMRKHILKTYLEVNEIDEVFIPEGLNMNFRHRNSFDIVKLIKRSKVPYNEISFERENTSVSDGAAVDLSQLFLKDLSKSMIRNYESNTALS